MLFKHKPCWYPHFDELYEGECCLFSPAQCLEQCLTNRRCSEKIFCMNLDHGYKVILYTHLISNSPCFTHLNCQSFASPNPLLASSPEPTVVRPSERCCGSWQWHQSRLPYMPSEDLRFPSWKNKVVQPGVMWNTTPLDHWMWAEDHLQGSLSYFTDRRSLSKPSAQHSTVYSTLLCHYLFYR